MAQTGKLLLEVTFVSQSGFDTPEPWNGQIFDSSSGNAVFSYGANLVLRLTGDITGDYARVDLPLGFQITSVASQIKHVTESGFVNFALWGLPYDSSGFGNMGMTLVDVGPNLPDVGFTSDVGFTDSDTTMDDTRAVALLYPFDVTFTIITGASAGGVYRSTPSGGGTDYPFYWEIADWEIPDVIGPPPSSAPIVEVVPGGINVTAGPGTTIVVVSNPGTVPSITVPVTPGVLVFVPIVPPNNPVVTVTPYNGPVVGTPTVVAVPPQFDYTMAGGIDLGGSPALQFIGNPSGIYTLVPGKAYDTLYERIPAVTSQDVKIPDPFIVTAYVGE